MLLVRIKNKVENGRNEFEIVAHLFLVSTLPLNSALTRQVTSAAPPTFNF